MVDNLKRRGIKGPSRCVFYCEVEETQNHMFLKCNYTTYVCKTAFVEFKHKIDLHIKWKGMFTTWHKRYSETFLNKPIQKEHGWQCPSFFARKYGYQETKLVFINKALLQD
jgi:hypothetical protein